MAVLALVLAAVADALATLSLMVALRRRRLGRPTTGYDLYPRRPHPFSGRHRP